MYGSRPVNMTNVVLNSGSTSSFGQVRMYGAGAKEAADERLLEQVRARRLASNQAKAGQVTMANDKAFEESAEGIQKQLAEIRARRQFLEEELKKNKTIEAALLRKAERAAVVKKKVNEKETAKEERERKRNAALEQKKKEMGAKPAGVAKVVTPKKSPQKAPAAWVRKYGKAL
jgi:hypothetical protein